MGIEEENKNIWQLSQLLREENRFQDCGKLSRFPSAKAGADAINCAFLETYQESNLTNIHLANDGKLLK